MHDTFLNANLYEAIKGLCKEYSIKKIKSVAITVHKDSHISAHSLREYFEEKNSPLFDTDTCITVLKDGTEHLSAVIEHIDGEKIDT